MLSTNDDHGIRDPQIARPNKPFYRGDLPHFQGAGGPLFVTFHTYNRWILPEEVRKKVLEHCVFDHQKKIILYCAVVMPDHVHLIYQPLKDQLGNPYGLEEVIGGLKGASSHTVNKLLNRKGHVWQDESFDHALRSWESLFEKIEYVRNNPVRKGICTRPEDYPWLWVNEVFIRYLDDKRI